MPIRTNDYRGNGAVLVILDSINGSPEYIRVDHGVKGVCLLSLNPDKQLVDLISEGLIRQGITVDLITAAGKLDDVALRAREKFSELVAEIPKTFSIGKSNLKEAFVLENRLSLWWLNDLSSKRSDAYPTFTRICQLEVIREVVESTGAKDIYLTSKDCDFWDVVASYCQSAGLDFRSPRPRPRYWSVIRNMLSAFKIIGVSLNWFLRTAVQTFLAKRLIGTRIPRQYESERPFAFHTYYPGMLRGENNVRDDKYAGVPDFIRQISGVPTVYACTLSSDGLHQSVSIRRYLEYCRWLRSKSQAREECYFHLMDADLKWRDFWCAIQQLSIVWGYWRLQNSTGFRDQWTYDGASIFPLIRGEFSVAMLRIPRYVLHARRVRRFVDRVKPRCFVAHLFEFCYGRAAVYGVKTSSAPSPVIGTQHGPSAKRKLLYYNYPGELRPRPDRDGDFIENAPIPDWVIVEGEGTRDRLIESGYPKERLVVGGAPRLDELLSVPMKIRKCSQSSGLSKRILVAFGQHDGAAILSACLPVMGRRPDCHFIFKLHPRSGLTAEAVATLVNKQQILSSYEVATGGIYELFSSTDVVLTTYSSVGMEAVARGYPVICLQLPNIVNASPILDVETPGVVTVTNDDELDRALSDETITSENAPEESSNTVQYFFGQLDGLADQRWAEAIIRAATLAKASTITGEQN